jgi:Protein of unknown function, DUF547
VQSSLLARCFSSTPKHSSQLVVTLYYFRWDCRNRRILNCGQLYFRAVQDRNCEKENALETVQRTLRLALETVNHEDNNTVDVERRRRFLDNAASLKRVCVGVLSEQTKVAFFLNLYHVMIVHAFLIVGPPGSWFKWFSYFNNIAYQGKQKLLLLSLLLLHVYLDSCIKSRGSLTSISFFVLYSMTLLCF